MRPWEMKASPERREKDFFSPSLVFLRDDIFLPPPPPLLSESGKNVAPAKAKKEKGEVDESAPPPRPCA